MKFKIDLFRKDLNVKTKHKFIFGVLQYIDYIIYPIFYIIAAIYGILRGLGGVLYVLYSEIKNSYKSFKYGLKETRHFSGLFSGIYANKLAKIYNSKNK